VSLADSILHFPFFFFLFFSAAKQRVKPLITS
jgi:hypothetical protein